MKDIGPPEPAHLLPALARVLRPGLLHRDESAPGVRGPRHVRDDQDQRAEALLAAPEPFLRKLAGRDIDTDRDRAARASSLQERRGVHQEPYPGAVSAHDLVLLGAHRAAFQRGPMDRQHLYRHLHAVPEPAVPVALPGSFRGEAGTSGRTQERMGRGVALDALATAIEREPYGRRRCVQHGLQQGRALALAPLASLRLLLAKP